MKLTPLIVACLVAVAATVILGGCSMFFSAGGQPTVITTSTIYAASYITTAEQLKNKPGAAAADLNLVARAVKDAIQSPPNVEGLKRLAADKAANSQYGIFIIPIINSSLDQAAQNATAQQPTVQQLALQALANDALRGIIDASAAVSTTPATRPVTAEAVPTTKPGS